jgi:zinc protease
MRRLPVPIFLLCLLLLTPWFGCRQATPALDDPRQPESTAAGAVDAAPVVAAETLPFDPAVRTGQLGNGLKYFVRANDRPETRAQLWLALDAGSILEDDDQRGLAHFVEHMAFNGTKRFAKQEIVEFLESIGMTFGPDVNAYTSFDETVYMLNLPTDDPEIMSKGLTILHEWASTITFDPEEVDKERGVVLEEWRRGRGAGARLRDVHFPVLLAGSRYAERLTIGDPDTIETAPLETLVRYYRDWYRPDLMAVIAVGDFDAEAMERSIRETFQDLSNPESVRTRTVFDVPAHDDVKISIASDPEQTTANANVYDKRSARGLTTIDHYRELLIGSLYSRMLSARFDELSQQPDVPFLYAGAGPGGFVRGADAFSAGTSAAADKIGEALYVLRREVERAARHGFSKGELERAKAARDRSY